MSNHPKFSDVKQHPLICSQFCRLGWAQLDSLSLFHEFSGFIHAFSVHGQMDGGWRLQDGSIHSCDGSQASTTRTSLSTQLLILRGAAWASFHDRTTRERGRHWPRTMLLPLNCYGPSKSLGQARFNSGGVTYWGPFCNNLRKCFCDQSFHYTTENKIA